MNATNRPLTQFGLPSPDRGQTVTNNRMMVRETTYNREEMAAVIETRQNSLTDEQATALDTIMGAVSSGQGGFIFLDAPGNNFSGNDEGNCRAGNFLTVKKCFPQAARERRS